MQLVSILIPAFNAQRYIRDSIESALAQVWPVKEIIVVDDGSTDATLEIARSYTSSRVQVITQNNRGASAARNSALSLAQGDYIQYLDADDMLAPDKISRQLKDAEPGRNSLTLLTGPWGKFYNFPQKARFESNSLWEDLDPLEWLYRKMNENLWMPAHPWLSSRALVDMTGPWNESLYMDNDGEYFCRMLSHSQRILFVGGALCYYRIGNLSLRRSWHVNDQQLESMASSIFSHIKILRVMEDSPRTRAACLKFLQRMAAHFYLEKAGIFSRMQSEAWALGGEIYSPPNLRKKYCWLAKVFGWKIANRAQTILPLFRSLARKRLELLSPWFAA
ncbi:MAG: glycosyltransferase family A protein, partial [Candidatus Omnitrophica bacterium]|nr:glycosyltransferase family A protein [Candidatus Omnitrophota bacterium]